jgi:hypothetical protein
MHSDNDHKPWSAQDLADIYLAIYLDCSPGRPAVMLSRAGTVADVTAKMVERARVNGRCALLPVIPRGSK